ncbi:MAG: hypothetical protein ACK56I_22140, partial [bacterium]
SILLCTKLLKAMKGGFEGDERWFEGDERWFLKAMKGGFEGDERWYRNANMSCTKKKLNTSASFNPRGGCHTCISGEHDAWIGAQGKPIVIVAADQHFSPNLPADGEGECIRILRVENGSLAEIARELTLAAP